jgi:hypothetical protein
VIRALLTDQSYLTAWLVYIVATVVALLILNAWTANSVGVTLRSTVLLVLAALALAPSHPQVDGSDWAPAFFVAGFDLLTDGLELAMRSLRSLLAGVALALVLSLLLYVGRAVLGLSRTPD